MDSQFYTVQLDYNMIAVLYNEICFKGKIRNAVYHFIVSCKGSEILLSLFYRLIFYALLLSNIVDHYLSLRSIFSDRIYFLLGYSFLFYSYIAYDSLKYRYTAK